MSDFFIGEIRMFAFDWPPENWALCNGASMTIPQHQALYALLGTAYGGDGRTNFLLPDLRGRVPLHTDNVTYQRGNAGGAEQVTLTQNTMPVHTHEVFASTQAAISPIPANQVLAATPSGHPVYAPFAQGSSTAPLIADSIGNTGGGAAHANMQPFTVINFCVSLTGIYPPHQ